MWLMTSNDLFCLVWKMRLVPFRAWVFNESGCQSTRLIAFVFVYIVRQIVKNCVPQYQSSLASFTNIASVPWINSCEMVGRMKNCYTVSKYRSLWLCPNKDPFHLASHSRRINGLDRRWRHSDESSTSRRSKLLS